MITTRPPSTSPYLAKLCDELRAYADDPASVADIRTHLLAADLEKA